MTQANQLRVIPDSETFSATTKYLGSKKVEAIFSLRRDAKSQRYEKKATFDFEHVTEEELYLLAMYACKVKLQALLRNLSAEVMTNAQTLASIDVKRDLLEADKGHSRSGHGSSSVHPESHWPWTRPQQRRCSIRPSPKPLRRSRNRRSRQ